MGVDEIFCNLDIGDLQGLVFDDTEKGPPSYNAGWLTSELCVPTDPIDDLEWFPSFRDDFISLNDMGLMQQQQQQQPQDENQSLVDHSPPLTPEQRQETTKARKNRGSTRKDGDHEIEPLSHGCAGFATTKKARKKNYHKPKSSVAWVKKRCSHCEAEETPQWRNGPSGPKTLCNACGVRYKSGRLMPEYRPATSPTFDAAKHSNYHKKILKRRSSY